MCRPLTGARIETIDAGRRARRSGSPPHGGADRNTSPAIVDQPRARFAPSRGRGSKQAARCRAIAASCRPLTGARIETFRLARYSAVGLGRPLTGARIETRSGARSLGARGRPLTGARIETGHCRPTGARRVVRPLTGARIETAIVRLASRSPCSPPHGGADRNAWPEGPIRRRGSPPHGGAD